MTLQREPPMMQSDALNGLVAEPLIIPAVSYGPG
jgi:hypothetical protein